MSEEARYWKEQCERQARRGDALEKALREIANSDPYSRTLFANDTQAYVHARDTARAALTEYPNG